MYPPVEFLSSYLKVDINILVFKDSPRFKWCFDKKNLYTFKALKYLVYEAS